MTTDAVSLILREIPTSDVVFNLDLRRVIEEMDADSRALLVMWMAGYTQEQIGKMVNLTQPTICYHLGNITDRISLYLRSPAPLGN